MTAPTMTTEATTAVRSRATAAWVLRRAMIGIAILCVAVGGSAWLLHASIDPSAEAAPDSAIAAPRQG